MLHGMKNIGPTAFQGLAYNCGLFMKTTEISSPSSWTIFYKKFWKELICLLSLHYLKMSFELKPAFSPT
jgi:hypothetical protein